MEIMKDYQGLPSSMRWAFIVTVVNANLIAAGGCIYSIWKTGQVAEGLGILVTALLVTAFGGKAAQAASGK